MHSRDRAMAASMQKVPGGQRGTPAFAGWDHYVCVDAGKPLKVVEGSYPDVNVRVVLQASDNSRDNQQLSGFVTSASRMRGDTSDCKPRGLGNATLLLSHHVIPQSVRQVMMTCNLGPRPSPSNLQHLPDADCRLKMSGCWRYSSRLGYHRADVCCHLQV